MNYGYIRVSSDHQTVENQRFEINTFCKREGIEINGWIEETISGTKTYKKRELGKLLKKVNKDDLIICAELSRLGRNLFMIMEILNICMMKECRVWTLKDNYRLGDDIQSKVLAFAFGLSAEIERNLISQRTKEALAKRRADGVILGRPKGKTSSKKKLTGKEAMIQGLLDEEVKLVEIAKLCKVDRMTLSKFIEDEGLRYEKKIPNYIPEKQYSIPEKIIEDYIFGKMTYSELSKQSGFPVSALCYRVNEYRKKNKDLLAAANIHDATAQNEMKEQK